MIYSEKDIINIVGSIYDIQKEPNEFFHYNGLLIKNRKNIDSIFFENFKNENIINQKNLDLKDTKEEKNVFLIPKSDTFDDKQKKKKDSMPSIYYFDDILQKFRNKDNEKNKLEDLFNKINFVEKIEKVKKHIQFLENKRRAPDNDDGCYEINKLMEKYKNEDENINKNKAEKTILIKKGRKPTKNNNSKTHDKLKPDNIIIKIKAKIFEYSILFLNTILNKVNENEKLLSLDYKKYINKMKSEENIKYLNMKLKDLFSREISKKYSTKPKDFNKNLIKKELKKSTDETIKFAFNITLRDWLDLFTLKKSIEGLLQEYNCVDKNIDCEKIKKSIFDVDVFLNKIMDKNGKEYLTPFIFLLYNYERWFSIKRGRKNKK